MQYIVHVDFSVLLYLVALINQYLQPKTISIPDLTFTCSLPICDHNIGTK